MGSIAEQYLNLCEEEKLQVGAIQKDSPFEIKLRSALQLNEQGETVLNYCLDKKNFLLAEKIVNVCENPKNLAQDMSLIDRILCNVKDASYLETYWAMVCKCINFDAFNKKDNKNLYSLSPLEYLFLDLESNCDSNESGDAKDSIFYKYRYSDEKCHRVLNVLKAHYDIHGLCGIRNADGLTLLHLAARKGYVKSVTYLLENGVSAEGSYQAHPEKLPLTMMLNAYVNHLKLGEFLLKINHSKERPDPKQSFQKWEAIVLDLCARATVFPPPALLDQAPLWVTKSLKKPDYVDNLTQYRLHLERSAQNASDIVSNNNASSANNASSSNNNASVSNTNASGANNHISDGSANDNGKKRKRV